MNIGPVGDFLKLLALFLVCGFVNAQEVVPRFEPAACLIEGAEKRSDVRCGYLIVRENRELPNGRTLRLSVAVLKSSGNDPQPDPLVFLSGGPGDPSVKNTISRLNSQFWNRHRAKRDLVLFDQRGTGFSDPEFCQEMTFSLYTSTFRGLPAAERQALVVEAVTACRKIMLAKGIDFGSYNSAASAQDLDDLRRALGYEQWNLFGVSYGTRLALTAMRDTPVGIRSAIIDSPWPPNAPIANSKEMLMRSLTLAFAQCAAIPDCHSAFPALRQDVFSMLRDFEANPMTLEMGDPDRFPDGRIVVDGNVLAWGLLLGFYEANFIRVFPLFVREVRARNENVLTAVVDGLVFKPDMSLGLRYAVNCYEWITRISPEMVEADSLRHVELDVWQAYADQREVCESWHDYRAAESALQAVQSDIPTLVFAGEFDPITPPAFGRLAADTLPRSTFVEVPASGHGVVPYTECTRNIMDSFLDRPSGSLDTTCIEAIAPISFTTDVHMNAGIYRLTKEVEKPSLVRALGFGLIILLLTSAIVVWPLARLVRRMRSRPESMPAGAVNARLLAALTSLLGLAFLGALRVVMLVTAQDNPYLLGFGVPGYASPVFMLSWLFLLGTGGVVLLAMSAWRRRWWTLAGRLHYLFVAIACVGLIVEIFSLGLL